MGKPRQFMVHTLSDGTKVTAADVASRLECDISTARCRLTRSKNVESVYKPIKPTSTQAIYTLDDGSKWTLSELADETGLTRNAMGTRLHKSRKPEDILKPKSTNGTVRDPSRISEAIKQSMYFDPLGHWKLLNKTL